MSKYKKQVEVVDWDAVERDLLADIDAVIDQYAAETGDHVGTIAWRARRLIHQRYFG